MIGCSCARSFPLNFRMFWELGLISLVENQLSQTPTSLERLPVCYLLVSPWNIHERPYSKKNRVTLIENYIMTSYTETTLIFHKCSSWEIQGYVICLCMESCYLISRLHGPTFYVYHTKIKDYFMSSCQCEPIMPKFYGGTMWTALYVLSLRGLRSSLLFLRCWKTVCRTRLWLGSSRTTIPHTIARLISSSSSSISQSPG